MLNWCWIDVCFFNRWRDIFCAFVHRNYSQELQIQATSTHSTRNQVMNNFFSTGPRAQHTTMPFICVSTWFVSYAQNSQKNERGRSEQRKLSRKSGINFSIQNEQFKCLRLDSHTRAFEIDVNAIDNFEQIMRFIWLWQVNWNWFIHFNWTKEMNKTNQTNRTGWTIRTSSES